MTQTVLAIAVAIIIVILGVAAFREERDAIRYDQRKANENDKRMYS